jgi:hypothetical protein
MKIKYDIPDIKSIFKSYLILRKLFEFYIALDQPTLKF